VDGVIYVSRRSLKGSAKFLWSAIELAACYHSVHVIWHKLTMTPVGLGSRDYDGDVNRLLRVRTALVRP
jgi:hypothetical protein